MNDTWDGYEYDHVIDRFYDQEKLVTSFRSEIVMGLYETVEIQSASKEGRIVIDGDIVRVVDNDKSVATQIWSLSTLRDKI